MGIRDDRIDYVRQRLFIPYMEFAGYVEATDTFQSDDSGNRLTICKNRKNPTSIGDVVSGDK